MLDGLRGEHGIAELCRREGIAESLYYTWSKEFLEAGKRRLAGDTARAKSIVEQLEKSEATNTMLKLYWLPTINAKVSVCIAQAPVVIARECGQSSIP